jgi:hypothetical protein
MRQLPIVKFEGTHFYVDIRLQEFRQVDNLHNSISFSELIEDDQRYILFYNTSTKNIFEGMALTDDQAKNLKIISVPLLTELDPEGIENYLTSLFSYS